MRFSWFATKFSKLTLWQKIENRLNECLSLKKTGAFIESIKVMLVGYAKDK